MKKNAHIVTMLAAALLIGCGGGDTGQRANVSVLPEELLTPPCSSCQPATIQGVVAAGAPFVDADVTVIDENGIRRSTRTDGQGHYLLAVQEMEAPFVVRSVGLIHGQTRTLHTVVLPVEVGRALSNITPLTEVITAQVLQGLPHDLLQDEQIDFRRINTRAVRAAQAELKRLVRPVLDAAGVSSFTDLRGSPFQADHTGMDLALDSLVLTQEQGAYRLRHVLNTPAQALLLAPVGSSSTDPLADPPSMPMLQSLTGLTSQVSARLQGLTALYADRLPTSVELTPLLTSDFLSDGLTATAYLSQVLRRQDSSRAGGFSLQGARWSDASIIQVQDDSNVLVAFRVTPRPPFAARVETSWMRKNNGQWQWSGNGKLASVEARFASVLGEGPTGYSSEVTSHLVFEVDRRRVDPRIAQILVKGPGLPASGISLVPPLNDEDPAIAFWSWAGRQSDDWPAIPWGWCPDQDPSLLNCQESWTDVQSGSTYEFTLLDSGNHILQVLTTSLPPKPERVETLKNQAGKWFARFVADEADTSWLPTLAHMDDAGPNPFGGAFPLSTRVQSATVGRGNTEVLFDVYLETPASTSADRSFSFQRARRSIENAPGTLGEATASWSPTSGGAQPRWAVLRLTSKDSAGNAYIHALSPTNPR